VEVKCEKCERLKAPDEHMAGWQMVCRDFCENSGIFWTCPECQGIVVTQEMRDAHDARERTRQQAIDDAMEVHEQRVEKFREYLRHHPDLKPLRFYVVDRPDLFVEVHLIDVFEQRFKAMDKAKDDLLEIIARSGVDIGQVKISASGGAAPTGMEKDSDGPKDEAAIRMAQTKVGLQRIAKVMGETIKENLELREYQKQ